MKSIEKELDISLNIHDYGKTNFTEFSVAMSKRWRLAVISRTRAITVNSRARQHDAISDAGVINSSPEEIADR